jgi:hypothetical protein
VTKKQLKHRSNDTKRWDFLAGNASKLKEQTVCVGEESGRAQILRIDAVFPQGEWQLAAVWERS